MKCLVLPTLLIAAPMMLIADEVQMLDGKVYKDCTIEFETAKEISIVVPVSKTIKDNVILAKKDVKQIIKTPADEVEFGKLSKKYGEPSGLSDDDLKTGIQETDKFKTAYPKSQLLEQVGQLQTGLQAAIDSRAEVARQKAEEEKAAQPTEEELKRGRYDIEANKLLKTMKQQIKGDNPWGGMQTFESLKKGYSGSQAYVDGRVLASKLVPKLQANLAKMLQVSKASDEAEQKKDQEEYKKRKTLSEEDQKKFDEQRNAKRKHQTERMSKYQDYKLKLREKKVRWFKPTAGFTRSIEDLKRVADEDANYLARKIEESEPDAGVATEAFKKAWEAVDAKNFDEAKDWAVVIKNARVPKEYYQELDQIIIDGRREAAEEARKKREEDRLRAIEERRKALEAKKKGQEDVKKKNVPVSALQKSVSGKSVEENTEPVAPTPEPQATPEQPASVTPSTEVPATKA
jgi:hypothetical protein